MEIFIKNCNSIDEAKISIQPNKLNIKHGPNGTGKSTIAKAIALSLENEESLKSLLPFKWRGSNTKEKASPSVTSDQPIKSIALFNEEYIEQFIFTQDEVLKNSFDIFIKTPQYEQKMAEIEIIISDIRDTFRKDERIDVVILDLVELHDCFGKSSKGLSKAGKFFKGIGNGNPIEHVPEGLESYAAYIKSDKSLSWLKWQMTGNGFLSMSDHCPYCTSPTAEKKDTILAVSKAYDPKSVEHLAKIQEVIEKLGEYFSDETKDTLQRIVKNKDALKIEEDAYLTGVKNQVETLIEKLREIKIVSYFSLKGSGEIKKEIEKLKIDIALLSHLNSAATCEIVVEINASLDSVMDKAGKLQGEVNKQNKLIQDTARKHKEEINNFLRYAGYKYYVDIAEVSNSYKMKLKHVECQDDIENGGTHLSYGERNAFALVLFMYECLTKKPDLVVLDDPISSFDKNKKYAIIEMLFRSKLCLKNMTVLMLTHDIEPVIDMIKNLSHHFQPQPVAHFLMSKEGIVTEKEIAKENILSFVQLCQLNIQIATHDAIKAIYLRRHFEILDEKGIEYQLLSNVFKKRETPTIRVVDANGNVAETGMSIEQISSAEKVISGDIPGFVYADLLLKLQDEMAMRKLFRETTNNYEKLQIFRLINGENHENSVIKKFVNETYHIENEYIMQLNPHEFDYVPDHIVAECAKDLG